MAKIMDAKGEAIRDLRKMLKPGMEIRPVLRSVSRSGMSRRMDFYAFLPKSNGRGGVKTYFLTGLIAKALGYPFPSSGDWIKVDGCGMDMGFHVVYSLSATIFADRFKCLGEKCPSNDHSNGDQVRTPHVHSDAGYALRCEWL